MKSLIVALLVCVGLGGCVGPGFNAAKLPPEQLAMVDDARLAFYYGDVRNVAGDDSTDAKRLKAELQTRTFPRQWEWEHIDVRRVVPGMTASGVNAIFGTNGRGEFLTCSITPEGEYEEGHNYKLGYRTVGVWFAGGTVSTVVEGGRVMSRDATTNTRRADAPLVDAKAR